MEWEIKNWSKGADDPESEGKREAWKTENVMEGLGGKWRTTAKDKRSWRLLIENSMK